MKNPWLDLTSQAPYLLEIDQKQIAAFAPRQNSNAALQLSSIPEPFIGNPETARVVLLLLNPGHDKDDPAAHSNPQLKQAIFRNLRHETQPFPFYPLNPAFSEAPTARWWIPCTRVLKKETGLSYKDLSERLLAIEWFPYHSKSSGLPTRRVCESQEYTFDLARKMIGNQFVLRMRSVNHWAGVDKRFRDVPALRNPQCCHISRRNTEPGVFEAIVKALI